jgi:hypothetical protein
MSFELVGFIIHVLGELMVGFTAVMVHHRFWKEHKIDENVFREMKREQYIGLAGLLLVLIGFFLQLPAKL